MFKVRIVLHLMPWEMDHVLLTFTKLKKGFLRLPDNIKVELSCVLNVSDKLIDWNKSRLPKEFFIQKFNELKPLVSCFDIFKYDVVDYSDRVYGHFDLQKESMTDDIDGYIYLCTDRNFDDSMLPYMCVAASQIKDKYFILSSETYKAWDSTWDVITSKKYMEIPYNTWNKLCPFEIEMQNESNDVSVERINAFKFAGWFEFYSRDFVNKLVRIPEEWTGYGPWDFYAMVLSYRVLREVDGVSVSQYVLRGKLTEPMDTVDMPNSFSGYYRDFIFGGDTSRSQAIKTEQRDKVEATLHHHVDVLISDFKSGKIQL
jgi:hypothetical protein